MSALLPLTFSASTQFITSVEIDAPVEEVWQILIDLPSYPLWNPLHRSAIIVDEHSHKPTEDPSLRAPAVLELAMQNPATLDSTKKPMVLYEHLSLVDHETHRLVWGGGRLPSLFRAEHAEALSTTQGGRTLYEIRHAFGGLSGHFIKLVMGGSMPQSQQAAADALKKRAESRSQAAS